MKIARIALVLLPALAACSYDSSPLIFGQALTVGITLGTSPASPGTPEFTLGMKQVDIAIVPTVIPKDVTLPDGEHRRIASFAEQKLDKKGEAIEGAQDALSTFGSFENENTLGADGRVKLGVFFATGVAAQRLAEGFACAMGVTQAPGHCEPAPAAPAAAQPAAKATTAPVAQ